jgi:hypothetical protein
LNRAYDRFYSTLSDKTTVGIRAGALRSVWQFVQEEIPYDAEAVKVLHQRLNVVADGKIVLGYYMKNGEYKGGGLQTSGFAGGISYRN